MGPAHGPMLVNLVPEFLACATAPDPAAAYHDYLDRHRPILASYWHNYVLELGSPQAERAIAEALRADRTDLVVMSTHGLGGGRRWWLGSVAERFLRHSPCPLVLINVRSGCPTDG